MPREWAVTSLREIFKVITGTTPSTKIEEYWNGGTIEWLTPKDMSYDNSSLILPKSERKITEKALKETTLSQLPENSILISTRAPVGYIGINSSEITFNQGCKGLVPLNREETSPHFYAYYLKFKTRFLNSISGGSTFKELSKEALEHVDLPLPQLTEQQKIAEILTTVDREIELARMEKSKLENIKKWFMQELLSGRIRVGDGVGAV
jgi:type I restriction enzyme S subunit